jgi:hydroxypyruvate isomerase
MPRFAANLSLMFTEWEFLDRFAVAADHGFRAVEVQFPYDHEPEAIRQRLEAARLELVLINAPPGDAVAGDRGLAAVPGRFDEFRASMARAMIYAEHLNAKAVHVMAGNARADDPAARKAYGEALRHAADRLDGFDILIEPLNPRDAPGYFLNDFGAAAGFIADLAIPRLKLQFDIYHRQILHGDVLTSLAALMPVIGHIQIASVPTRAEPNTGELNDDRILGRLDSLGYAGYVGCEYRPAKTTLAGLDWLTQWRRRAEGEPMFRSTWREPD